MSRKVRSDKEAAMRRLMQEDEVPFYANIPVSRDTKLDMYLSKKRISRKKWLIEKIDDINI